MKEIKKSHGKMVSQISSFWPFPFFIGWETLDKSRDFFKFQFPVWEEDNISYLSQGFGGMSMAWDTPKNSVICSLQCNQ